MSERVVGLVPPGDARVRIQHGLDTESPIFQVIDTETKTYVMPSVTIEGPDSVVVQFAKTPGVGQYRWVAI